MGIPSLRGRGRLWVWGQSCEQGPPVPAGREMVPEEPTFSETERLFVEKPGPQFPQVPEEQGQPGKWSGAHTAAWQVIHRQRGSRLRPGPKAEWQIHMRAAPRSPQCR